jgi:hypothetical protein
MAVQADNSKRNPTAGRVKTPAPDQISHPRAPFSGNGYGENGPQPSSVPPGAAMRSPLAENLKSTVDDPALNTVIARGTYQSQVVTDDKQLREIAAGNVPTHSGTRGAATGPKVPAKLGA